MRTVSVQLPKAVFAAESMARVCHRYTGNFYVSIRSSGENWQVDLSPMNGADPEASLASSFENDALDELLRMQIRAQSEGITELLLRTALRGSGLAE